MHLIDIDNLLGDPRTTDRLKIDRAFASYRRAANCSPGDHVTIATGRNGLHVLQTELAWPSAMHRRRAGTDGADRALLEDLDWIIASGRFHRVVIGSGDHFFGPGVERLRAATIETVVVARAERLSSRLARTAGSSVRILEVDPDD